MNQYEEQINTMNTKCSCRLAIGLFTPLICFVWQVKALFCRLCCFRFYCLGPLSLSCRRGGCLLCQWCFRVLPSKAALFTSTEKGFKLNQTIPRLKWNTEYAILQGTQVRCPIRNVTVRLGHLHSWLGAGSNNHGPPTDSIFRSFL